MSKVDTKAIEKHFRISETLYWLEKTEFKVHLIHKEHVPLLHNTVLILCYEGAGLVAVTIKLVYCIFFLLWNTCTLFSSCIFKQFRFLRFQIILTIILKFKTSLFLKQNEAFSMHSEEQIYYLSKAFWKSFIKSCVKYLKELWC